MGDDDLAPGEGRELRHLAIRLVALETVVKQLLVRLAWRDDDPRRWVAERKTLALRALGGSAEEMDSPALLAELSTATTNLFATVEDCVRAL